jgi:hypothetical protein
MRCLFSFVCSAVLVGAVSQLGGAEYKAPEGFSFTYPDDWTPVTKEQIERVAKRSKGGAGLVAAIRGPVHDDFVDHMTIFVKPVPPEFAQLDAAGKLKVVQAAANAPMAVPKDATNIKRNQQDVAGTTAITVSYEVSEPQLKMSLRQWLVYVPGKEKLYLFNCCALKSHWKTAWPVFKKMIDGVKIDVANPPKGKP